MTTPPIPHHFEYQLEVPGSPDEVFQAVASAGGISAWMMQTELEPYEGGAVTFHMGPDVASHGQVTAFEPGRRIAYEEDWATLVGQSGADVTPLLTEFLIEARSGGTCVVRVVTSAFGTGADWENEFWDEMSYGWAPMLDNLRLYMTHFRGEHAEMLWATVPCGAAPEAAIEAVRGALGIAGEAGDRVDRRGIVGVVERALDRHFLVRVERPVSGMLSFFSYAPDTGSAVQLVGYLFGEGAAEYVATEQDAWRDWISQATSDLAVDTSSA